MSNNGPEFFQTGYGRKYYEVQLPRITTALESIMGELKRLNDLNQSHEACNDFMNDESGEEKVINDFINDKSDEEKLITEYDSVIDYKKPINYLLRELAEKNSLDSNKGHYDYIDGMFLWVPNNL